MYFVEIRVRFRYAHRLFHNYVGKCSHLHGESGTAIIIVEGEELLPSGMLIDFKDLKVLVEEWINQNLDHTTILSCNDPLVKILKSFGVQVYTTDGNPTAENIAKEIFDHLGTVVGLVKVGVIESFEDSIAWYERRD